MFSQVHRIEFCETIHKFPASSSNFVNGYGSVGGFAGDAYSICRCSSIRNLPPRQVTRRSVLQDGQSFVAVRRGLLLFLDKAENDPQGTCRVTDEDVSVMISPVMRL